MHGATNKVKVVARVRPFNSLDGGDQMSTISMAPNAKTVTLQHPKSNLKNNPEKTVYEFDSVFWSMECDDDEGGAPATQEDVYDSVGQPLLDAAFNGYNACLLAYGQTGSGKTHTMMGEGTLEGNSCDLGIIPRLVIGLYAHKDRLEACDNYVQWTVKVGFVEIYCENVFDLVKRKPSAKKGLPVKRKPSVKKGLPVKRKPSVQDESHLKVRVCPNRGAFVDGQVIVEVSNPDAVLEILGKGNEKRRAAETAMNNRSSRSHAIFQIFLTEKDLRTDTIGRRSCVSLVDLAGSERVNDSQVTGGTLTETKAINRSLFVLGKVIDSLRSKSVVPYRESRLTLLLKDSFGGNSETVMVATLSPSPSSFEMTQGTLVYASKARDVVNTATVNEDQQSKRIRELEAEIAGLQANFAEQLIAAGELASVDQQLLMAKSIEQDSEHQAALSAMKLAVEKLQAETSQLRSGLTEATERSIIECMYFEEMLRSQTVEVAELQASFAEQLIAASKLESVNQQLLQGAQQRASESIEHDCKLQAALSAMKLAVEKLQAETSQLRSGLTEATERSIIECMFFEEMVRSQTVEIEQLERANARGAMVQNLDENLSQQMLVHKLADLQQEISSCGQREHVRHLTHFAQLALQQQNIVTFEESARSQTVAIERLERDVIKRINCQKQLESLRTVNLALRQSNADLRKCNRSMQNTQQVESPPPPVMHPQQTIRRSTTPAGSRPKANASSCERCSIM